MPSDLPRRYQEHENMAYFPSLLNFTPFISFHILFLWIFWRVKTESKHIKAVRFTIHGGAISVHKIPPQVHGQDLRLVHPWAVRKLCGASN